MSPHLHRRACWPYHCAPPLDATHPLARDRRLFAFVATAVALADLIPTHGRPMPTTGSGVRPGRGPDGRGTFPTTRSRACW